MNSIAGDYTFPINPTGYLELAAILQKTDELNGENIGVLISRGNIDLKRLTALITA